MLDTAALRARLAGVRDASPTPPAGPGATPPRSGSSPSPRHFRRTPPRRLRGGPDRFRREQGPGSPRQDRARADLPLTWHLIGHLQSNKAREGRRDAFRRSTRWTTLPAAEAGSGGRRSRTDDRACSSRSISPASRPSHGARPDELMPLFIAAAACRAARVSGLMLLPPVTAIPRTPVPSSPSFGVCGTPARGRRRPRHAGRAFDGNEPRLRGRHRGRRDRSSASARRSSATARAALTSAGSVRASGPSAFS